MGIISFFSHCSFSFLISHFHHNERIFILYQMLSFKYRNANLVSLVFFRVLLQEHISNYKSIKNTGYENNNICVSFWQSTMKLAIE